MGKMAEPLGRSRCLKIRFSSNSMSFMADLPLLSHCLGFSSFSQSS